MQILIAEDDVINRRTLEALLVKWGYAVIVVRDGVEAWKILLNLITGLSDVVCPLPLKTRLDRLHSDVVSRMLAVGRYSKTESPVMPILGQLLGAECCAGKHGSTYPGEK